MKICYIYEYENKYEKYYFVNTYVDEDEESKSEITPYSKNGQLCKDDDVFFRARNLYSFKTKNDMIQFLNENDIDIIDKDEFEFITKMVE